MEKIKNIRFLNKVYHLIIQLNAYFNLSNTFLFLLCLLIRQLDKIKMLRFKKIYL